MVNNMVRIVIFLSLSMESDGKSFKELKVIIDQATENGKEILIRKNV